MKGALSLLLGALATGCLLAGHLHLALALFGGLLVALLVYSYLTR